MTRRVLIFGGTSEAGRLIELLRPLPVEMVVSVATAYGHALLQEQSLGPRVRLIEGRLDRPAIETLLRQLRPAMVLDATHPFATEVTAALRMACAAEHVRYLRIVRPAEAEEAVGALPSVEAAAAQIARLPGRVLLTIGSKRLDAFVGDPGFPDRFYPRVLPSTEAIERCLALGYRQSHILAMQGPFSTELNVALLRQYAIDLLVTKASGGAGGFAEKWDACKRTGASLVVIGRPQAEEGLTVEEAVWTIRKELAGV